MDALIGSAYGHNEEFDTRKLNSTQKRMLQIEQHIKENYDTRYNEVLHIMEYRRRKTDTEQPEPFHILDEMMENSIWMEMNELGYSCTDSESDLLRLQHHLPSYSRVFRLAA